MRNIRTLITALLCTVAAATFAMADVTVSAAVNTTTVALDEQLVLQVDVAGAATNIGSPTLPPLPDFSVYSAGTSQNMSLVNGSFSSSMSFRYALVPKSPGKYTIPPITLQHDGKTYQTQPISVEIVAAGKAPAANASRAAPDRAVPEQGKGGKSLFVTATVDKPTAYVNEQVTYSFRFYRRIRLLSNPQYVPANFSGFWTEDVPPRNYYATIDGQQYLVTEVKTLLFPTRPGAFNLGNASLQCKIEDFNHGDTFSDDFFQSFFSGGKTQVVQTSPLSITVVPLPVAGKPNNFSGAVGQLKVASSLDRADTKTNEPVTLSITVAGTGNIKTLSAPALPDWPDFRKYETVSSLNISKDGDVAQGSKVFKTVIVPQTPGKKTLPPVSFSFFDPARKNYVTAMTPALVLNVQPGPAVPSVRGVTEPLSEVTVVNRDIRYIKNLVRWETYRGPLYRNGWFLALNALPLVLLMLTFGYVKRQERLNSDVAYARRLKASSTAKKYLKEARALSAGGTPSDFHGAVSRALLEYIAHKANVSAEGLTFAAIVDILRKRNVSNTTIGSVKTVLEECDLVRFAPAGASTDLSRTLEIAAALIGQLEKELR